MKKLFLFFISIFLSATTAQADRKNTNCLKLMDEVEQKFAAAGEKVGEVLKEAKAKLEKDRFVNLKLESVGNEQMQFAFKMGVESLANDRLKQVKRIKILALTTPPRKDSFARVKIRSLTQFNTLLKFILDPYVTKISIDEGPEKAPK